MRKILACYTIALVLAGCETVPTGPHVEVLPGTGIPFEKFLEDEEACQNFAQQTIGHSHDDSKAAAEGFNAQQRYDVAYEHCMSAKGNQIPDEPSPQ